MFLTDVRIPDEYSEKHISFAINVPIENLETRKYSLDLRKTIITVCGKDGGRSERAASFIRDNHIVVVFFLERGTFGWFENQTHS